MCITSKKKGKKKNWCKKDEQAVSLWLKNNDLKLKPTDI